MKPGTLIKFGNNDKTVGSSPQNQILGCENWRALWLSYVLKRLKCQPASHF
jgi:hypothetical protein